MKNVILVGLVGVLTACGGDEGVPLSIANLCQIDAPVPMAINSAGPINSKSVRRTSTIEVGGATYEAEVRGRGNSTWSMPKKPYRFKLANGASLLGMGANKDWVLLANYSDKTMLRTGLAWCVAKILDAPTVPESRFVELTLNGEYVGMYQLTWQIEVDDGRVPKDVEFLAEIDARADDDVVISSMYGSPYVVDEEMGEKATAHIRAMEEAIAVQRWDKNVDVNALSAYYVVSEFSRNNDVFWSSTYLYKRPGQKIVFGPLWDFDISFGNIDYNGNWNTEGYWARDAGIMAYFYRNEELRRAIHHDWKQLSERMPELLAWIDSSAKTLEMAAQRNFERWPILDTYVWPNAVVTGSYAGEVNYLKDWAAKRATWLDENVTK